MPEETPVEAPLSPVEFLKKFKNAPDQEKINVWKQSAPGGRVRLFTSSDGNRAYVLRGISAFELEKLQDGILKTIAPEKYAAELKNQLATKCTVWTSDSPTNQLTDNEIKRSGAGLVDSLHEIISELSDYFDTPQIQRFSADL